MSTHSGSAALRLFVPLALLALVIITVLFYSKGGSSGKPVINFIGIATGTLATDVGTLTFSDRFSVKDYHLVGIVGFDEIDDGSIVQATWFSPDDRTMPLGRTEIVTESGAKIAKFSIANTADWKPAPFMMDIRVFSREERRADYTASGSTHFFIGMTDQEIESYAQEFNEYTFAEAERQRQQQEELDTDERLLVSMQSALSAKKAAIAARHDVNGDGKYELIVTDPAATEEAYMQHLTEMNLDQFMIFNKGSGSSLLSLRKVGKEKVLRSPTLDQIGEALRTNRPVHATFSFSGDVLLEWQEGSTNCHSLLQFGSGAYAETERACKSVDG